MLHKKSYIAHESINKGVTRMAQRSEHDSVQDKQLEHLMKTQQDVWRVFRAMAEFVDGFSMLSKLGPCVSIFGSARIQPGTQYYRLAKTVAKEFVKAGYGVISGGGPGVMEAANRGAREAAGVSVGINIDLPHEQKPNPYIDPDKLITFKHFYIRKVMFVKYAQGFIVMPGGFGTLDEFFESITLIQTKKIHPFPVVMMGTEYWGGLISWFKARALEEGMISKADMDLFSITDDPKEAVATVKRFYKKEEHRPNF
jgi:uncharacterized protein (TIGR00730 family)